MKKITVLLISFILIVSYNLSAQFVANYDETKVPDFKVPDLFQTFNGKRIKNIRQWEKIRKPELQEFFTEKVFGKVPGNISFSAADVVEANNNALNGKAHRRQVELMFEKGDKSLAFTILIYLPKNVKNAPVFLGYNFVGNHSVCNDPEILISSAWAANNEAYGIKNNQLNEKSRGAQSGRWAIEKIIDAGFGLATIYYGEVDPDKNDYTDGIHTFFYKQGQTRPADNEWGSIAAWAWGLSRAMDYFETENEIDESKVVVFGHSRLGKTSIWAGVADERFAAVISNNSGCGGAALSKRKYGETLGRINSSFPHWFCKNFWQYSNNEDALPVDQHQLLALIAPRPLYVASAEEDQWADPKGEFLSAYYASEVYKMYGETGLTSGEMPKVNSPIQNTVSYHIRTGKHDVTDYDWEQYLIWAKRELNTGKGER